MIDVMAFVTVFLAALIGAVFVVATYSLGIRFLATPATLQVRGDGSLEDFGPDRDDEDDDVDDVRPRWATMAAYFCFAAASSAVLFGIYLVVPAFHK